MPLDQPVQPQAAPAPAWGALNLKEYATRPADIGQIRQAGTSRRHVPVLVHPPPVPSAGWPMPGTAECGGSRVRLASRPARRPCSALAHRQPRLCKIAHHTPTPAAHMVHPAKWEADDMRVVMMTAAGPGVDVSQTELGRRMLWLARRKLARGAGARAVCEAVSELCAAAPLWLVLAAVGMHGPDLILYAE